MNPQNLNIKNFQGTTPKAAMIWIAVSVYMLLGSRKFSSQINQSLRQLLWRLLLNLLECRDLRSLRSGEPPDAEIHSFQTRLLRL
jgi:hypothetical protein